MDDKVVLVLKGRSWQFLPLLTYFDSDFRIPHQGVYLVVFFRSYHLYVKFNVGPCTYFFNKITMYSAEYITNTNEREKKNEENLEVTRLNVK